MPTDPRERNGHNLPTVYDASRGRRIKGDSLPIPATLTELVDSFKTQPNTWQFKIVVSEVDHEEGLNAYQKMGIALTVFLDAGRTPEEKASLKSSLKQKFSIPDDQFDEFMKASKPEPGKLSAERVLGIYAKAKQSVLLGSWALGNMTYLQSKDPTAITKELPQNTRNPHETEIDLQNRLVRILSVLVSNRNIKLEELSINIFSHEETTLRTRVLAEIISNIAKSLMLSEGKTWDEIPNASIASRLAQIGIQMSRDQVTVFINTHREDLLTELYPRYNRNMLKKTYSPTEEKLIHKLHAEGIHFKAIMDILNNVRAERGESPLPYYTVVNVALGDRRKKSEE